MEIMAKSKYLRVSPRKLRLVAKSLRGLEAKKALVYLSQIGKRGGEEILETLKQAIANAKNNFHLQENDLKVKNIEIGTGPIYKRFQPISRGQAHPIKKRTSHISLILEAEGGKNGAKS